MPRNFIATETLQRQPHSLTTTYLKNQCLFPVTTPTVADGVICTAGAGGTNAPYTTGYVCLALNYKNGAGERDLSKNILDIFAGGGVVQTATPYNKEVACACNVSGTTVTIDLLGHPDETATFVTDGSWSGTPILVNAIGYIIDHVVDASTLELTANAGTLSSVPVIHLDGSGATVGDVYTLVGNGSDDNCQVRADTVDANGYILTSTLIAPGTNYAPGIYDTTGGTGSNVRFTIDSDMMQHPEGWWYDSYNTYLNPLGATFDRTDHFPNGNSGDLLVDSDASLLAWAMADWDIKNGSLRYQTTVAKALDWLYSLQQSHHAIYPESMLQSALIYLGQTDTTAELADCAEALLAAKYALDAYGAGLLTSNGHSVKDFANAMYASMTQDGIGWGGTATPIYRATYPHINAAPPFPFNLAEPITFTQSLCAWANVVWATSGYLVGTDNSSQAGLALDYTYSRLKGAWGGQLYTPFDPSNLTQTDRIEHTAYTALMCLAMQAVNSSKYAKPIAGMQAAMRRIARTNGMVWGQTHPPFGRLTGANSGVGSEVETYGLTLTLDCAQALFAGA